MSKNELNSVEFYAKAEKDLSDRFSLRQVNYTQYREKKRELLEQAKAMHKEEIINACEDCSTIDGEFLSGRRYYQETFEYHNTTNIIENTNMLQTQTTPTTALFQQIVELQSKISELNFQLEIANLKLEHESYMHKEYERMFTELKQTIKNL